MNTVTTAQVKRGRPLGAKTLRWVRPEDASDTLMTGDQQRILSIVCNRTAKQELDDNVPQNKRCWIGWRKNLAQYLMYQSLDHVSDEIGELVKKCKLRRKQLYDANGKPGQIVLMVGAKAWPDYCAKKADIIQRRLKQQGLQRDMGRIDRNANKRARQAGQPQSQRRLNQDTRSEFIRTEDTAQAEIEPPMTEPERLAAQADIDTFLLELKAKMAQPAKTAAQATPTDEAEAHARVKAQAAQVKAIEQATQTPAEAKRAQEVRDATERQRDPKLE